MVSRLLLLNRRAQGLSKQTFFEAKHSEWRSEAATCYQAGHFPCSTDIAQWFVPLLVFCAIPLYLCVSVCKVLNSASDTHLTCTTGAMHGELRATREVLYTVQWWGTLPNKWLLCVIVQGSQLSLHQLAVCWLCFTSELPWKNMTFQRAE